MLLLCHEMTQSCSSCNIQVLDQVYKINKIKMQKFSEMITLIIDNNLFIHVQQKKKELKSINFGFFNYSKKAIAYLYTTKERKLGLMLILF